MPAKLDRCVRDVKKSLTKKYVEKYGKQPGKKKKKEIEQSAWAICRSELNMTLDEGGDEYG